MRQQQAKAVRAFKAGRRRGTAPLKVGFFLRSAAWRQKTASPAQLRLMETLGLTAAPPGLTSGEAADAITRHFLRLASDEQRQRLQQCAASGAWPGGELPVPLLHEHTARLLSELAGAPPATAGAADDAAAQQQPSQEPVL